MEKTIEVKGNQVEKIVALSSIIELARAAGLTEIETNAEQELGAIEKNEAQNEQEKTNLSEDIVQQEVDTIPVFVENRNDVGIQIEKLKEEINNSLNVDTEGPNPELKTTINQEFTSFKEFSKNISNFKNGELVEGLGRQSFTYNSNTGELLPSKEGLSLATVGVKSGLKEAFNFDPKLDFDTPIEQLQFKSALIGADGTLIQKGEIVAIGENNVKINKDIIPEKKSEEVTKNNQERDLGSIPYQEYSNQFSYFDSGEGTSFTSSSNSAENIFSYNPETGQVLPRKGGWEFAKTNLSYFLGKYFTNPLYGEKLNIPLEELRFVPAKINKQGVLIEKGKIIEQ